MDEALRMFRILTSEFSGIPDEDDIDANGNTIYGVKTYMEIFASQVSCRQFGKDYAKALAYLTAHKLKMMDKSDNADADGMGSMSLGLRIASASEGETSVSFGSGSLASSNDPDADLALTYYGIEFLKLRRAAVIAIRSAGEPVYSYLHTYPHTVDCINQRL